MTGEMIMKKTTTTTGLNIEIFKSEDGKMSFDVTLENETVWLTQKQISELFNKNVMTINEHIKNVFAENELEQSSTIRKFRIVQKEGNRVVNRNIEHYNLDLILSVGYRVQSKRATQFRQWATTILKQHLIDGYSINEKRLIERKKEIEIKESIDIISGIFLNKGIKGTNETKKIIENVSTYIGKSIDNETMVLKSQILIERFMIQFLKTQSKNEKALDNSRFTFRHLITICQLQYEPEEKEWLWELLEKLCKIRNNFAHILEVELVEESIKEFIRICTIRLEKKGISIKKENKDLKTVLVHLCGAVSSTLQQDINTKN
jgi:hypothetical protein